MKMLCELLIVCLLGALHAKTPPEEMRVRADDQHVGRRYVESTIASQISKIVDSMRQKNFVAFLLNQRVKKQKSGTAEKHPKNRLYKDLLKLHLQEKLQRLI